MAQPVEHILCTFSVFSVHFPHNTNLLVFAMLLSLMYTLWYSMRMVTKQTTKKKYKRDANFVSIPFQTQLSLGTLGSGTVLTTSGGTGLLAAVLTEDLFIISMDTLITLRGLTAGEVPLYVGMAHGAYSVTQIAEALDAAQTGPDDVIAMEQGRRKVRRIGVFAESVLTDQVLTNLKPDRRTRVRFSVGSAQAINGWVRNQSGAALTTNAIVEFGGTIYGRWQR